MGAAVFAYAAKIYSARAEETLRRYGNDLATRAKKAGDWATANPRVLYYNNDDIRQPGSRGLAAGQQEMDDAQRLFAKFEAAVYLYELTGDPIYKSFVESNYTSIVPSWGPTLWDLERQESLLYYTRLPGISAQVRSAILTKFIASITGDANQLPMVTDSKDPYRSPIKAYVWGSNQDKAQQARLYQLLALYGDDVAAAATAQGRTGQQEREGKSHVGAYRKRESTRAMSGRHGIGLRRVFGEAVGGDQAAAFRFPPSAPVWRRGIADIGDGRPACARWWRHAPAHHHHFPFAAGVAHDGSRIVGKHARHARKIAGAVGCDSKQPADGVLASRDAVEVAHDGELSPLERLK